MDTFQMGWSRWRCIYLFLTVGFVAPGVGQSRVVVGEGDPFGFLVADPPLVSGSSILVLGPMHFSVALPLTVH